MPYDDPDSTDPLTLHGVAVETSDDSAVLEMAECFIDEYARLGFTADRILHLFDARGYAGPYMATMVLGRDRIRRLVEDVLARWGGRRPASSDPKNEERRVSLTVLNG